MTTPEHNPFAPPKGELLPEPEPVRLAVRDDGTVEVVGELTFPRLCVTCGTETERQRTRTIKGAPWFGAALPLILVPFGIGLNTILPKVAWLAVVVVLIVIEALALQLRHRVQAAYSVCESCQSRLDRRGKVAVLLLIAAIASAILWQLLASPTAMTAMGMLGVAALILYLSSRPPVRVLGERSGARVLTGFGPRFLLRLRREL